MRRWGIATSALLIASSFIGANGCGSPTAPTPEEGVTLYVDRDYRSTKRIIDSDETNLAKAVSGPCNEGDYSPGNWDDCVSSIRVSPGWAAVGYRDRHFSGPTIEITQDIPSLRNVTGPCDHGFDDCLSSIRVFRR
jgi:hypothetical protein